MTVLWDWDWPITAHAGDFVNDIFTILSVLGFLARGLLSAAWREKTRSWLQRHGAYAHRWCPLQLLRIANAWRQVVTQFVILDNIHPLSIGSWVRGHCQNDAGISSFHANEAVRIQNCAEVARLAERLR